MGGVARPVRKMEAVERPAGLDSFVGHWVALKEGEVVAVASNSRALVYEVRKLGDRGRGAVAQYVAPPASSYMVGVG